MNENMRVLRRLSGLASGVWLIMVGLLLASLLLAVLGTGVRPGWLGGAVCLATPWAGGSLDGVRRLYPGAGGAETDVIPRYCASDPTVHQHLLQGLGAFASYVLVFGGVYLVHRLLRSAAREGMHTVRVANGLRALGWWILTVSVVAEIVQTITRTALLRTLAEEPYGRSSWSAFWAFPYYPVLSALGLLAFARMMRASAAMREDLEGTV
ncbi:hypothetical protein [uncultured Streptomyces sp.]|uniref:hypothetical protein n=1 Tax=uncultured Streptomyces sp. TaxID=174707 RepID=UPI002632E9A8|nr:hypothetical protein [uncultured Streptomyces sp.]